MGTNVSTNFITCPADANKTLGIKLPFLVMIIKNVMHSPLTDYAIVKEVLHFRSASPRRQECKEEIQSIQLPIDDESETIHLHDAHATGRRVEPNSIQLE
jgi:hypothetical protein